uniref:Glyco_hydro_18 domain-containing protein n=1 Tax=Heterorhabditis bacteriophora TaxID=37862 RepID=A0A1I7WMT0_HETBA
MSVSLIGERSDYSTFYGLRSFPQITPKSADGRIISQTQICEAKNDNGTLVQWLDELAVPFLFRHTEFVAFDNEKSVRIKASSIFHIKLRQSFLKKYSFTGVELRCADIVSRETKVPFANFLRHLNKNMNEAANERDCPNTVSLRLSAWMSSLRSMYDLSVLNSLHHVVLEPFTVPLSTEAAFVNSPLFKVEAIQDGVSIDTTIREWESAGLNRSQVLVQIPSYGMEQTLKNSSDPGVGKPTEKKYSIIGQSELCHRLKYAGTDQQMRWDSMTTNAWTTEGRWISLDNQQTVFYKMRYCLREGLAGVGLMSLNEDDHVGTCGSGIFPILHSISTKCH